jgi:hypothetical protein
MVSWNNSRSSQEARAIGFRRFMPRNRPNRVLSGEARRGHAPCMTSEQRDFLRKQIDARIRERLERARSERAAQARTYEAGRVISPVVRDALAHPRREQSGSLAARAEVARSVRSLRAGK